MKREIVKISLEETKLINNFMDEVFIPEISFNDIMLVIDKIENIKDNHHGRFGVHIYSNVCSIQGSNLNKCIDNPSYGWVYMSDPNAILNTKLQSVVYNVLDFIKWYNTIVPKEIV
jgi:hypothetical protein